MEMLRLKKDEKKMRPIPFYIDWVIKEDLEVVLKQQAFKRAEEEEVTTLEAGDEELSIKPETRTVSRLTTTNNT